MNKRFVYYEDWKPYQDILNFVCSVNGNLEINYTYLTAEDLDTDYKDYKISKLDKVDCDSLFYDDLGWNKYHKDPCTYYVEMVVE